MYATLPQNVCDVTVLHGVASDEDMAEQLVAPAKLYLPLGQLEHEDVDAVLPYEL